MWCSMQSKLPNTKLVKNSQTQKYSLFNSKISKKKSSLLSSKTDHCNTDLILIITHDLQKVSSGYIEE